MTAATAVAANLMQAPELPNPRALIDLVRGFELLVRVPC